MGVGLESRLQKANESPVDGREVATGRKWYACKHYNIPNNSNEVSQETERDKTRR